MTFLTSFVLLQDLYAQANMTRQFFYNLPIDISKEETINSINSDSTLFLGENTKNISDKFYSTNYKIKQYLDFIPVPSESPTLRIYDTKVYVNDSAKFEISNFEISFVYNNSFGNYKEAKRAYNIITNKTKQDYKDFQVQHCILKDCNHNNNCQLETKCFYENYKGMPRDPDFTIALIQTKDTKVWTIVLNYSIQKS